MTAFGENTAQESQNGQGSAPVDPTVISALTDKVEELSNVTISGSSGMSPCAASIRTAFSYSVAPGEGNKLKLVYNYKNITDNLPTGYTVRIAQFQGNTPSGGVLSTRGSYGEFSLDVANFPISALATIEVGTPCGSVQLFSSMTVTAESKEQKGMMVKRDYGGFGPSMTRTEFDQHLYDKVTALEAELNQIKELLTK